MGVIEELAQVYRHHIALPWLSGISGAQRVLMVVYDKQLERRLRARTIEFENATREAGHRWELLDISASFGAWMGQEEPAYRTAYFENPADLQLQLDSEFPAFLAQRIRTRLQTIAAPEDAVLALLGVGSLYGFTRVTTLLKHIEPDLRGRLLVFFPGTLDGNNYRLLDARDGWNYLAVPITLHRAGAMSC